MTERQEPDGPALMLSGKKIKDRHIVCHAALRDSPRPRTVYFLDEALKKRQKPTFLLILLQQQQQQQRLILLLQQLLLLLLIIIIIIMMIIIQ